ncbi:hypothetical protein H2509_20595 [Stappia sp. F7233]|uniref:Uncharacterized protein n=1 Tax=Stappia albiluteola TaxID=2758565 RepID=A0A839AL56_9HYPH|nr:hypothetical protein [Stappia albiluteola]MBA5777433.1 hypothetical protein [Stappia albiluteola]MBA5779504.1 hypothetical protein [Stappia albiluteola]MBA5779537.1 hypothetical protein [Stappia albiluteola]
MTTYSAGTISLSAYTNRVTGNSTQFVGNVRPGDWLVCDGDAVMEIAEVVSNTELRLYSGWPRGNRTSIAYVIEHTNHLPGPQAGEVVFSADGQAGRVSIYYGPEDLALEADPFSDLSRVKFHSDLPYISVVNVIEGTMNVNSDGVDAYSKKFQPIFSHGLGYTPLVFGAITNARNYDWSQTYPTYLGNITVPWSGTVPLAGSLPGNGEPYTHMTLDLGADINDVFLMFRRQLAPANTPRDDLTIAYKIFITDYSMESGLAVGGPPYALILDALAGRLVVADGKFDSEKRQLVLDGFDGGDSIPAAFGENVAYGEFDNFQIPVPHSVTPNAAYPFPSSGYSDENDIYHGRPVIGMGA